MLIASLPKSSNTLNAGIIPLTKFKSHPIWIERYEKWKCQTWRL
jgi:hypothetical protein